MSTCSDTSAWSSTTGGSRPISWQCVRELEATSRSIRGPRLPVKRIDNERSRRFNRRERPMSEEDNKAIVGRWFTGFWGADFDPSVIDELAAPNIRFEY